MKWNDWWASFWMFAWLVTFLLAVPAWGAYYGRPACQPVVVSPTEYACDQLFLQQQMEREHRFLEGFDRAAE